MTQIENRIHHGDKGSGQKQLIIPGRMKFPARRKVEMMSASGVLRVTISAQANIYLVIEVGMIATILAIGWKQWPAFYHQHPVFCILSGLGLLSGLWYQIAGSEEIEFNQQYLIIRKNRFIWPRASEYPLRDCNELEIWDNSDSAEKLKCRVRGSTITFGTELSEEQANNILAELQRVMPEAAHQLLSGGADPFGKHFTTLKLS